MKRVAEFHFGTAVYGSMHNLHIGFVTVFFLLFRTSLMLAYEGSVASGKKLGTPKGRGAVRFTVQ